MISTKVCFFILKKLTTDFSWLLVELFDEDQNMLE